MGSDNATVQLPSQLRIEEDSASLGCITQTYGQAVDKVALLVQSPV